MCVSERTKTKQCQNTIRLLTFYISCSTQAAKFPYHYNSFSLKTKMNRAISEMCIFNVALSMAGGKELKSKLIREKEWVWVRMKWSSGKQHQNMGDENADISSHGLFQCHSTVRHKVQCTINMSSQFSLKFVKWNHACTAHIQRTHYVATCCCCYCYSSLYDIIALRAFRRYCRWFPP